MAGFDVKNAAAWNPHYARTTTPPWKDRFYQVANELGFDNWTPNAEAFAEGVYDWQRSQGLSADGILGPKSWRKLEPYTRYSIDLGPRPSWMSRPKPTSPGKKKKKQTASTPTEQEVALDALMKSLQYDSNMNSTEIRVLKKVLTTVGLQEKAVVLAELATFIEPWSNTRFWLAFTAPFAIWIKNLIALHKSLTTGYRVTGHIGFVYGYCAYIFDKSKPQVMSGKLDATLADPKNPVQYTQHRKIQHRKHWVRGVREGWEDAGHHAMGFPGSKATFKTLMRFLVANDPKRLCERLVKEMARQMPYNIEGIAFIHSVRAGNHYPH